MANFEAQVRVNYRDVAGLVLSCARGDIVEEGNTGFVREWINRAPGLPSKPFLRNPGDPPPTYLGGRFSNPKQTVPALQPTLALTGGGEQRVQFDRARSTFLETKLLQADLSDSVQPLACAYQFTKGGDASNNQVIFDATSGELKVFRRNGAGDAVVDNNGDLTTVAGDHDDGTFVYTAEAAGTSLWQKDGAAYGTGVSTPNEFAAADSLLIGKDAGGNFLDGTLDTINLWACELSPLTIDFIWQTLNRDAVDFSTNVRAPMSRPIWTDVTGDLALDQFNRLRPIIGVPFRYIRANLPNPVAHRVQVAAAIDGIPLPDTQLGGDEFTYSFAEFPGIPPVLLQDAGWSGIADFNVDTEGHYTLVITRANGGSVIVHFDVEIAP